MEKQIIENYVSEHNFHWETLRESNVTKLTDMLYMFVKISGSVQHHAGLHNDDLIADILKICESVYDESEDISAYYIGVSKNGTDGTTMLGLKMQHHSPTIFSEPLCKELYKVVVDKTKTITKATLYKLVA